MQKYLKVPAAEVETKLRKEESETLNISKEVSNFANMLEKTRYLARDADKSIYSYTEVIQRDAVDKTYAMNISKIPSLEIDNLFLDDGSEDCNFGFKSSADNINIFDIDKQNEFITNSVPATPLEIKKFDFVTTQFLNTKEFNFDDS